MTPDTTPSLLGAFIEQFAEPRALWLLLLIPVVLLYIFVERRTRAVLKFSAASQLFKQGRGLRSYFTWLLPALRVAAFAFAVIALARPQERDKRVRDLSVEGIDIMIALDLSTSMEAADFRPNNRLFVAKDVLSEFLDSRRNDRIGLVVFSGAAYTQAPLTLDYGVVKDVLRQLKTRVIEVDGTAIGDAVATSLNRLRDSDAKSRVVILITDGDNNAGKLSPVDAASMAQTLGIPVYTILVGKGGRVPFPAGVDLFGNPAWRDVEIPINPELLENIAKTTGGQFYRATDRDSLKAGLNKVLDSLEKSKILEGGASATYTEHFHLYLIAAFVFLCAEVFLRNTLLRISP